jgi:hypothetical protein
MKRDFDAKATRDVGNPLHLVEAHLVARCCGPLGGHVQSHKPHSENRSRVRIIEFCTELL